MSQLQKGTNYTATGTSSFVTHTNLNAHVDNARLVGGAIDEQESNSISEDNDLVLINKGGQLYKQTKSEFTNEINSNLINTNTVNAELVEVDDVEINDTLLVGGTTSLVGPTTVDGNITVNSTSNLKGEVQYNGTPVYGLYSVTEAGVNAVNCLSGNQTEVNNTCNQWLTLATIPSLTKTNKEIWKVEATFSAFWYNVTGAQNQCKFRLILASSNNVLAESYKFNYIGTTTGFFKDQIYLSAFIAESTVFTNDSIRVEIFYANGTVAQNGQLRAGPHGDLFETGTTNKTSLTKYIKP